MNRSPRCPVPLPAAIAIAAWLTAQTASAILIVNATPTPLGGGLFQYEFTISNTGPADVPLVNINNAPLSDPDIGSTLMTPAGFLALYDPGLGIVTFLEDTSLFAAGTTIGGFSFQSAGPPGQYFGTFDALDVNGAFQDGNVNFSTTGVPDAGSTLLLAAVAAGALAATGRNPTSRSPGG